ncbi:hypothetical protein ABTJ88_19625, partial [Acinetobacter baumannii]
GVPGLPRLQNWIGTGFTNGIPALLVMRLHDDTLADPQDVLLFGQAIRILSIFKPFRRKDLLTVESSFFCRNVTICSIARRMPE